MGRHGTRRDKPRQAAREVGLRGFDVSCKETQKKPKNATKEKLASVSALDGPGNRPVLLSKYVV
jgi:hypothetical protein